MAEILILLEGAQEKSKALVSTHTFTNDPKYAAVIRGLDRQIAATKKYAEAIHLTACDDESGAKTHQRP
jgi:hypothetical protein